MRRFLLYLSTRLRFLLLIHLSHFYAEVTKTIWWIARHVVPSRILRRFTSQSWRAFDLSLTAFRRLSFFPPRPPLSSRLSAGYIYFFNDIISLQSNTYLSDCLMSNSPMPTDASDTSDVLPTPPTINLEKSPAEIVQFINNSRHAKLSMPHLSALADKKQSTTLLASLWADKIYYTLSAMISQATTETGFPDSYFLNELGQEGHRQKQKGRKSNAFNGFMREKIETLNEGMQTDNQSVPRKAQSEYQNYLSEVASSLLKLYARTRRTTRSSELKRSWNIKRGRTISERGGMRSWFTGVGKR